MDAAAFLGSGVLAARLNDFIEENLDDAAAIASLTDVDLRNVNGSPLSESELVRMVAWRLHAGGVRARAAQLGRSRRRVFCARAPFARQRPPRACDLRAVSAHTSPTRRARRPAAGGRRF